MPPIFADGRGGRASGVKEFTTLPSQNKKCPAYATPTQFRRSETCRHSRTDGRIFCERRLDARGCCHTSYRNIEVQEYVPELQGCVFNGVYHPVFLAVVGTKAHKTVINAIIEMRLRAMNQLHAHRTETNTTHSGCKLLIPVLDAMAPVKNGKSAEPACPKPAIQPIDPTSCGFQFTILGIIDTRLPVRSQPGRMRAV